MKARNDGFTKKYFSQKMGGDFNEVLVLRNSDSEPVTAGCQDVQGKKKKEGRKERKKEQKNKTSLL